MIVLEQDHFVPEPPPGCPEGMKLEDFTTAKLPAHYKYLFRFTMPAGCGVPSHPHTDDSEIYIILDGELVFIDNGVEHVCHQGDMMICYKGDTHGVENRSSETAHFLGIVVED